MSSATEKRQISIRMSLDEWADWRRIHHDRCIEAGRWISQTAFIKELLLGARLSASNSN